MRLFLLLALVMAISIIVFTVQNSAEITLTFINWTLSGPLALILAVPFIVGVIAGASLLIPIWWKKAKALKAQKKRPWPTRQYVDVLNEAVNQGILVRAVGGPEFEWVVADGERELLVPKDAPPPLKPQPTSSARETSEMVMGLAKLQDFVDESAPELTKLLAGASPEFAVRVKLKGKAPADLTKANDLLGKVDPEWRFGGQ